MASSTDLLPKIDEIGTGLRSEISYKTQIGDIEAADKARVALRVHRLRQHAKAVVDSFPPPSQEQLDTVVTLLNIAAAS